MTNYCLEEFKEWLREKENKTLADISGVFNITQGNFQSFIEHTGEATFTPYMKKFKALVDEREREREQKGELIW